MALQVLNQVIVERHKSASAGDARPQSNWPGKYSEHVNASAVIVISFASLVGLGDTLRADRRRMMMMMMGWFLLFCDCR